MMKVLSSVMIGKSPKKTWVLITCFFVDQTEGHKDWCWVAGIGWRFAEYGSRIFFITHVNSNSIVSVKFEMEEYSSNTPFQAMIQEIFEWVCLISSLVNRDSLENYDGSDVSVLERQVSAKALAPLFHTRIALQMTFTTHPVLTTIVWFASREELSVFIRRFL